MNPTSSASSPFAAAVRLRAGRWLRHPVLWPLVRECRRAHHLGDPGRWLRRVLAEGAQGDGFTADFAPCAADPDAIEEAFVRTFARPPVTASAFDTLLLARGENAAGFRVERANLGGSSQVRLMVRERAHR